MRYGVTIIALSALACGLPRGADAQLLLPRDLEVQVARSALPAHLRQDATVYVYDPSRGYIVAHEGTNGFHAMASRTDPAIFRGTWDYTTHFDDVLLPIAFDATGARTLLQPFLDAGALIAAGIEPRELKRQMAARFASGHYRPADRAGVSFMLSPVLRAFADPYGSDQRVTRSVPHRMFYAPNLTNPDIGGLASAATQPFVIQEGPWGYMVQRAGPAERDAIVTEHREMLERLCALRKDLCLRTA